MESTNANTGTFPVVECQNIETIDDLFGLYARLSGPLKDMEAVCERQEDWQKKLTEARGTISAAFVTPFITAISWTVILAIPFVIVFLVASNLTHAADGRTWFEVYDTWLSATAFGTWYNEVMAAPMEKSILLGLLVLLVHLIIWFGLFPCIIILLPIMFVFAVIFTVCSVISAKHTVQKSTVEVAQLETEINARIEAMSDALAFVPPDYRFSMAVEHFCQSYYNQKASDLKEAVNLFDIYVHQLKMEQGQQEMLEAEQKMLSELAYQSAQIDKLNREVKGLRRDVRWNL